MTVVELIEELRKYPADMRVLKELSQDMLWEPEITLSKCKIEKAGTIYSQSDDYYGYAKGKEVDVVLL